MDIEVFLCCLRFSWPSHMLSYTRGMSEAAAESYLLKPRPL